VGWRVDCTAQYDCYKCDKFRLGTLLAAATFTAGHDGGVEALAQSGGQFIDLVGAVDFDGLAGGVEDDLAVAAASQMRLQLGANFGGHSAVNQIIEKAEKLFAGHFPTPVSPCFAASSFVVSGRVLRRK